MGKPYSQELRKRVVAATVAGAAPAAGAAAPAAGAASLLAQWRQRIDAFTVSSSEGLRYLVDMLDAPLGAVMGKRGAPGAPRGAGSSSSAPTTAAASASATSRE